MASKVAPIDKLSVVFAIILAVVFLHEQVSWQQWVGGLLIAGGAVILAWF
jgi:transporter family protein